VTEPIDSQIAAIKTRLAAAQRARGRAEHERDAATAAAETARRQLAEEFNVHTTTQAQTRLADLETELHQHMDELRTALEQIGV
jgi:predicted  nucleic acid-binding Zn-ribbon protein